MDDLDNLGARLQRVFARRPFEDTCWREPVAMSAALARIRQSFGDRLHERSGTRTNRSLLAFRLAPEEASFVDLKLICRALTRPADWAQRRLIDDDRLFEKLLAKVDRLDSQPRRYQACLRALETASRELMDNGKSPQGNELRLKNWLESANQTIEAKPR